MGSIKQSLLEQSLPFLPIRVENRNWKNRLLSALISNLGHAPHLAHNSLGNRSRFPRLFAFSSKPGPCPKSRDSPIISAGQKIFSRKRGGGVLRRTSHDVRAVSPLLPRLLFLPLRNVETSILMVPKKWGFGSPEP